MAKHVEEDPFDEVLDDGEGFAGDDSEGFTSDDEHANGFSGDEQSDDDHTSSGFDASEAEPQGFDTDAHADGLVAQPPVQARPFLKSPFGIAVVGIATLGVVGIGVTGYRVLQSPVSEAEQAPSSHPINPKGVVAAGEVDFGGTGDPVVAGEAKEVIHAPAPLSEPQTAAQVLNMAKPVAQSVVEPVAVLPPPAPAPAVAISPEFMAEHDALKKRVEEQQSQADELVKSVSAINQALAKLSTVVEKSHEDQILLGEQVKVISDKLEAIKPSVAPVATPEADSAKGEPATAVVAANANPKVEGRERIRGLQVVDSTASGHMVVVKKASNGRVFTMFEGERINTPTGQLRVNAVLDNGKLLLIGDKYYLDTVVEDYPGVKRAPAKPKPEPETKKVAESKREAPAKPVEDKPKVAKISVLKNYTLNAVYGENNKSFGVVTNSGDFKTFKEGDKIEGVGVVEGLDADGNLKAGNFVIESVY